MPIETFRKRRPLGESLNDFIITRIDFDRTNKKLVSFSVLQVHSHGEANYEVIKYDTAHGHCHMHRFYRTLDDRGEKLEGKSISQTAFDECRKDINKNWRKYKALYVDKWLK
jgi:hypothetical protein